MFEIVYDDDGRTDGWTDAGPWVSYKLSAQVSKKYVFAYANTKAHDSHAVTTKLISPFVFVSWIVPCIYSLYIPKAKSNFTLLMLILFPDISE